MSIRKLAEADLALIIENESDFGWPIAVTNPDGDKQDFIGLAGDISQIIDPDTGDPVSGRFVQVSLRISTLLAAGFEIPINIIDSASKPWLVEFETINGELLIWKVSASEPDRTLGLVKLILELYRE